MNEFTVRHNRPPSYQLHPLIYKLICVFALLFMFSAWKFVGNPYAGYLIAVVIAFVGLALLLPYLLWRQWHRHSVNADTDTKETFGDWASGEFLIWQDRVKGSDAAIQVLLPIMAVAFGMAAFAIVSSLT